MSVRLRLAGILCVGFGIAGCAPRSAKAPATAEGSHAALPPSANLPAEEPFAGQTGYATWYGPGFAGRRMANGQRFDPRAMTAAHRTLPLGTWVDVTRRDTGRTVRVRITDRGPFGEPTRIIDLSKRAAEQLGMIRKGVAPVELRVVAGP
ncbi:MAG: septal ring lytic transglycosylase RlpA family protein [Polyangiaceae bacterium]